MAVALLRVRVARKVPEAQDITSFELVAEAGGELPQFEAGAHIDVHIPDGPVRQYSLCNAPGERHRYQIAVLREVASRGGSVRMHEQVQEGDTLTISAPRNHFPLHEEAAYSVLLAGGIGVTPLIVMAERLQAIGHPFELRYFTRTAARTAFLQRIRDSRFNEHVRVHHDDGPQSQRLDLPQYLSSLAAGTHLYVCGPQGFLNAVRSHAQTLGWPTSTLHYEYFSNDAALKADDGSFEIILNRSGRVVRVGADQTVTDALAAAGVPLQTSCEQGICGTCLTRVLAGTIDHRDLYLTPEEQARNDQFLPCCSRALSPRLILDL